MKNPKVFTDAYQLVVLVFQRTKNFSKPMRPTLGGRLEVASIDLLMNVKKATVTKSQVRLKYLQTASRLLDDMRLLVQLSRDMQCVNSAGFGELSVLTNELGRELGGLIRYETEVSRHVD